MQPLLIILLLLSVLTNVLLILLLLRSGQQNTAEDQTDEIARIVRDEVEAETEVLADQLRVMQGEVTRTTSATAPVPPASALPTMPCWLSCRCWKPA